MVAAKTVETAFSTMGATGGSVSKFNILLFLSLLGALVVVVTKAGGSKAYGNWAANKLRSATAAQLATSALGALIFIDDYFNCLTVGTVMKPVTDKYGISRESWHISSTLPQHQSVLSHRFRPGLRQLVRVSR